MKEVFNRSRCWHPRRVECRLMTQTWKIASWQGSMTKKQSRKDSTHIQSHIISVTSLPIYRCVAEAASVAMALSLETRRDHATMKAEQSLESTEYLEEGTCHTLVICK